MTVRELLRHLIAVSDLDSEIRAFNVHDPQDEFLSGAETGSPITSVLVLDDLTVAAYYVGPKVPQSDDNE